MFVSIMANAQVSYKGTSAMGGAGGVDAQKSKHLFARGESLLR